MNQRQTHYYRENIYITIDMLEIKMNWNSKIDKDQNRERFIRKIKENNIIKQFKIQYIYIYI